ncbi:uncharacterized protein LOC143229288 [Tachypleus tridentatus]|uniref:uncharacterized protein LOC143229288 n=1 Tax=Tachypleus tridentatus TaxID=6853 RepID=UPI003FD5C722
MTTNFFILLASVTAVLAGDYLGPYHGARVGVPTYGYGYGYAPEHYYDQPIPYGFGYDVQGDDGGAQQRHEEDDGYGNKKGSYSYVDPYGVSRIVEYVADQYGFRANVKTNEPGTANQSPADVGVYSNEPPVHVIQKAYVGPHVASHPYGYAPAAPVVKQVVAPAYAYNPVSVKQVVAPAYAYNPVSVVKTPVPVYHSLH